MSLDLNFGPQSVSLGSAGDLAKYLSPGIDAVLHLDQAFAAAGAIPGATLADVPEGEFTFKTDRDCEWNLGTGANLTLSLQPEFGGSIGFTRSGPVVTWRDGEDQTFSVNVPDGMVAVSVEFHVGLAPGAGLSYSAGNFGVTANLGRDDTFLVRCHRSFPAGLGVFEAVRQAFERFTLPFLPASVATLGEHDLLEFEFQGRLNAGFGLSYGLGTVQVGGRSAGEISRSLDHGLVTASLRAAPALHAGAAFALTWSHEDNFRYVFARDPNGSGQPVSLTIFRCDRRSLKAKETLGITFDPGATFDFTVNSAAVVGAAVDRLFADTQPDAAAKLKEKLTTAGAGAVDALTSRINSGINDLLKKAPDIVQLQLLQERATSDTALFRLHFDFATPAAAQQAIARALAGDIAGAVTQPGVTVDPGSFLEHEFLRRTSFGFQFFDLWKYRDAVEYIDRVDLVYAGNGMLRLVATEGVKHSAGIVGRESVCDVHFIAQAGRKMDAAAVVDVKVTLHFVLLDKDHNRAWETSRLLSALSLPDPARAVEQAFDHGRDGVQAVCAFARESYGRIQADPYPGGKPSPLPHTRDAANYQQFAVAVNDISGRFLGFASYDQWAIFNRVANDRQGSTMVPDRRSSGNLAQWPDEFSGVSADQRNFIRYSSESARHFLNLCEALAGLGTEIDAVRTEADFTQLVDSLNGIVDHDVPPDFIKATLLALIRLAGTSPRAATSPDGKTLSVTIDV